jgi:glycosyltransferase involved in cell wall biosynthesis
VWVPNESTGKTLRDYGYQGDLEVFENGTDMIAPSEEEEARYRERGLEKAGVTEGEFVCLFVGQHRWVKNIRLILDGLKVLRDRGRSFQMLFVGEGSDTREIVRAAEKNKLSDHVRFMGVITNREELKTMYAAADLFLFPSTYDNAPLVLREAAAFRVPAVLIKDSTAAESVDDGVNGFTCENDAGDFAETVEGIMNDEELRKTAGEGARNTIYRSWESIVDEVHERYRQILDDQ